MNYCAFSNLISLALGIIASAIVTVVFLYIQFRGTIASHRIKECINATKELLLEQVNLNAVKNKYRYSMSVVFYRLLITAKKWDSDNPSNYYPSMLRKENDGWEDFNQYVRPVISDINSVVFISFLKLFGVKYMRELNCLKVICLSMERITALLDGLRLLSKNKKILEFTDFDTLRINDQDFVSEEVTEIISLLRNEYFNLFRLWNKWLEINKVNNPEAVFKGI